MAFFWTSAVVAGIGTEPTIELAKAISLTTENGVIVNELLRNSRSTIRRSGNIRLRLLIQPVVSRRLCPLVTSARKDCSSDLRAVNTSTRARRALDLKIESFLVLDRDIFGFRQGILKFLSSPGWPRVADEFERAENEGDADSLSAGSSAKACCLTHRRHVRRRLPGWRCETCVHRNLGLSPLRPAEASSRRYPFATGQIPDHRSQ